MRETSKFYTGLRVFVVDVGTEITAEHNPTDVAVVDSVDTIICSPRGRCYMAPQMFILLEYRGALTDVGINS